jgi:large subunit ribosomal protein L5
MTKKARLEGVYKEKVVPALIEEFKYGNVMQVPHIEKVVINMGLGEAIQNPKAIDEAVQDISIITGQKPVICKARRSIATYKLREGVPIGVMVTMRRRRMWEFLDRLIHVAIPRVRDFKGVSTKAFDGKGNYSLGVREQIIFPEIDYDKISKIRGMNITIVTSAVNDEESRAMLRQLGMPFRKKGQQA